MVDGIKPEREIDLLDIRGRANEAIQAVRSHEKLNDYQFASMEDQIKELKEAVEDRAKEIKESAGEVKNEVADLRKAMDRGFANTDRKFWSLAITIIMLLLSCCAALIWKIVINHG